MRYVILRGWFPPQWLGFDNIWFGISVRWSWIRACWAFVLSLAGSRHGLIKKFTQPSHSDMNSNHTLTLPETKPASSPSKKSAESIVFQQQFTFRGQLSVSFREDKLKNFMTLLLPKCSIYEIFTYIYHKSETNVGKYSIHGASGLYKYASSPKVESDWLAEWIFTTRGCITNLSQNIVGIMYQASLVRWIYAPINGLRFARDESCQTTCFLTAWTLWEQKPFAGAMFITSFAEPWSETR